MDSHVKLYLKFQKKYCMITSFSRGIFFLGYVIYILSLSIYLPVLPHKYINTPIHTITRTHTRPLTSIHI